MNDLARLLVKLAGLIVIVWTLIGLPSSIGLVLATLDAHTRIPLSEIVTMSIVPSSLSFIAGLVMFWGAGPVVDRFLIIPVAESGGSGGADGFKAIEEIALTVLGFYILVDGLGEGVYYWGEFEMFATFAGVRPADLIAMSPKDYAGIAAAISRVIFGIALIFFSRGFSTLRRRILSFRPLAKGTEPEFTLDG